MVPAAVLQYVERLVAQTGEQPEVEETFSGWTVTARSERVLNIAHFRRSPGNRVYHADTEFFVDGLPRPLLRTDDLFGQVWADPDFRFKLPSNLPPEADPETAPFQVRAIVDRLRPVLGDFLRVGRSGSTWVLSVETESVEFRVKIGKAGRTWGLRRVLLVLEGIDRSEEVSDNLERAVALMAGVPLSEPDVSSTAPSTSTPRSRSNSVEVRNTHVIRN